MNLEQLEAVAAVVDAGSFRAAAEKLRRSQPALSATIKNLEEEFQIKIFDRSAYRPTLTETGAAFLNVARATLEAAHYTARVGEELGQKKAETKLHISVDSLISTEVIELIAQECARPLLPVSLVIDKSILKGSYQPLLDGKIDLAIAPCPRDEAKIEKIILEEVTLVGVVSRKLLQEKHRPTAALLARSAQIVVYDKRFDEPPDELLPKHVPLGPAHKIFVPDHFTKLRLIEGGVGWGRLSRSELEAGEGLVKIDSALCAPLHLELSLLRARRRAIGPVARAIWKAFEVRAGKKVRS